MITQIKRSIPDLRSIKHQPLQNKESPSGSPRGSHLRLNTEQIQSSTTATKETDAVTLSAVAVRTCSCGTSKDSSADKNVISDELDALPLPHTSCHPPIADIRYSVSNGMLTTARAL